MQQTLMCLSFAFRLIHRQFHSVVSQKRSGEQSRSIVYKGESIIWKTINASCDGGVPAEWSTSLRAAAFSPNRSNSHNTSRASSTEKCNQRWQGREQGMKNEKFTVNTFLRNTWTVSSELQLSVVNRPHEDGNADEIVNTEENLGIPVYYMLRLIKGVAPLNGVSVSKSRHQWKRKKTALIDQEYPIWILFL